MSRILAAAVRAGSQVTLEGWLHRRRIHARITFLVLRDRSGLVQVVATDDATRAQIASLTEETVIRVSGVAQESHGAVEIADPVITVLSPAVAPPLELGRPTLTGGLPFLLDHAPISWRHPRQQAVWRRAAASLRAFRSCLDEQGFTEIQTPKLVGSSTESGANVFVVDYFGRPAYLAQSPQFYKQTMVGVFERVYEVGPVFRAEPHDTVRHLAEYVSLDVELGFIRDHHDVIDVLHSVISAMAAGAVDVPDEFPVVHFAEALRLVGADPDEPDLAPEHERRLGEWALAEFGSEFLVVQGYPAVKRPFYTHPQPDDPRWTNSFDLLFRGLELVTGGQRLHRYEDYVAALTARGESLDTYGGYLQAFRHGMPPHGGFAIGLERWVARLVGADNVRRTTLFPRDLHRLTP